MFCVERHQMCINDGNWRRSWVCAFGASKGNIELKGAHCKGVRNVSSRRVGVTTLPTTSGSHKAIVVRHFDPPSSYRRHVNKWGKLIAESVECLRKPRVYLKTLKRLPWKWYPLYWREKMGQWSKQAPFLVRLGRPTLKSRSLVYWAGTLRADHCVLLFLERGRLWRIEKLLLCAYRVCMEALRRTCFYG